MTSRALNADVLSLEQKRAEQPLQQVVNRWSWETNPLLQLQCLSGDFEAALGYDPQQLIGTRIDALTATGADAARLSSALQNRAPFRDLDLLLAQRDGTPGLYRLSGSPVICPNSGAFMGFRGEGHDLTDPTAREQTLRRLIESTEAANRTKREFIANMSHELRTPLNAIIGFSELMVQEAFGELGDERYKSYAALTLDSANHLLQLITDLLDVAKIEAGRMELEESEIDPAELLLLVQRTIVQELRHDAPTLNCEIDGPLPILYADERKLKQVLLNLLSNAVKFTPSKGSVQLLARNEADGSLSIVVEDSGIGIKQDDIPTAFSPFGQLQRDSTGCAQGNGLGLPLSKALVELHGGELELTSVPGQGTVVAVRLPAWRCLPGSD